MSEDCVQRVWFDGGPWNKEFHDWNVCHGPVVNVMWKRARPTVCEWEPSIDMARDMVMGSTLNYATYELRKRCSMCVRGSAQCLWLAECVENCDGPTS